MKSKTRITVDWKELNILINAVRKHTLELQSAALNPAGNEEDIEKAKTAYRLLVKLEKRREV